jgi:hypothetical protein
MYNFDKMDYFLLIMAGLGFSIVLYLHTVVGPYDKYQLNTGEIVECASERNGYLSDCKDGLEYRNQTNYRKLP